jgi:hypothetical protein
MKRRLVGLTAILFLASGVAYSQSLPSSLTAKQVARADKLITKLETFETFTRSNPSLHEYRTRVKQLTTAVYESVSTLPEGNAKTDIATAARFYESAAGTWNTSAAWDYREGPESAVLRCANEKPGAYQRLCEATAGSPRTLLLAKARAHLDWAKASIAVHRTCAEKNAILRELELERRYDQMLAERAIIALRFLEGEVINHRSLSDFQEDGRLARVPYETFREYLLKTSADVESILFWLPENSLKYAIGNALHSYQDGGFWWASVYRSSVVRVSELTPSQTTTPSTNDFAETIPYTIAINFRQASVYLKRGQAVMARYNELKPLAR